VRGGTFGTARLHARAARAPECDIGHDPQRVALPQLGVMRERRRPAPPRIRQNA
jgi:hypothetical protein